MQTDEGRLVEMMKIALCVDGTEDRERCGRLIKAVAKNYDVNIEMSTFKNGEQLFFALDDPKARTTSFS